MKLDDIPTPALVIDAEITRRNIDRLAQYAASHKLGIRPHTKTHKNRMLAGMQLAAGAVGLTVAKVGEAEQMAEVGDDILLAYPAIDPGRTARVARLAREKTVRVAIDSATAVEILASAAKGAGATIGLLVDIDVGMGRTGVATPEDALKLAQLISNTPGVRLDGIMCYPGQVWAPTEKQGEALAPIAAKLQQTIDLWRKSGLEAKIVSGGSTPTAYQSHLVPQLTEMRPGTYIFNDMNCVRGNYATLEDCAARIVVTVVSDAVPKQIVIDAGTKTLTSDRCHPDPDSGHGYIVEYPNTKIKKLSEEHGQVDVSSSAKVPTIGERVTVIPNHICPCVNLQDNLWWLESDGEVRQLRVDARGKLS